MSEPVRLDALRAAHAEPEAAPVEDAWHMRDGSAHWYNPAFPGWYAWHGSPGWYGRLRLSTPPRVVGPLDVLADLGPAIRAKHGRP